MNLPGLLRFTHARVNHVPLPSLWQQFQAILSRTSWDMGVLTKLFHPPIHYHSLTKLLTTIIANTFWGTCICALKIVLCFDQPYCYPTKLLTTIPSCSNMHLLIPPRSLGKAFCLPIQHHSLTKSLTTIIIVAWAYKNSAVSKLFCAKQVTSNRSNLFHHVPLEIYGLSWNHSTR